MILTVDELRAYYGIAAAEMHKLTMQRFDNPEALAAALAETLEPYVWDISYGRAKIEYVPFEHHDFKFVNIALDRYKNTWSSFKRELIEQRLPVNYHFWLRSARSRQLSSSFYDVVEHCIEALIEKCDMALRFKENRYYLNNENTKNSKQGAEIAYSKYIETLADFLAPKPWARSYIKTIQHVDKGDAERVIDSRIYGYLKIEDWFLEYRHQSHLTRLPPIYCVLCSDKNLNDQPENPSDRSENKDIAYRVAAFQKPFEQLVAEAACQIENSE